MYSICEDRILATLSPVHMHWQLHTHTKTTHGEAAAGVRRQEGRKEGQREAWRGGWKDRHDGSTEAQRCQGPVLLLALQLC